jgi:hypothetical protein
MISTRALLYTNLNCRVIDGAKRKEILYGPYEVPPNGMINKFLFSAEKPCTNCYVTAMEATVK